MNEQGLHGVAGCGVVSLAVRHNLDGLLWVGILVQVHVADTISMTQHWNALGTVLQSVIEILKNIVRILR